MSRTFCTVIDDERANAVLHPYGETMAAARHWSFKQIHVLGHDVAAVKKEALRKFGLTARQFNGVRYDLDQAVNASEGTAKFQVRNLKDSIEATVERIAALERQMENAKTDGSSCVSGCCSGLTRPVRRRGLRAVVFPSCGRCERTGRSRGRSAASPVKCPDAGAARSAAATRTLRLC